jgi:hypothetical protein
MYERFMARYNLDIVGEADEVLTRLAQSASSKADAIRKALSVAAWLDETQMASKKILVEDQAGRVREVHWR